MVYSFCHWNIHLGFCQMKSCHFMLQLIESNITQLAEDMVNFHRPLPFAKRVH